MNKSLIILLLLTSFSFSIISQSPPLSVSYQITELPNDITFVPNELEPNHYAILNDSAELVDPIMLEDSSLIQMKTEQLINKNKLNGSLSISILLADTINIKKIHYKIGRSNGNYDLADGEIEYDNFQMNNHVVYSRTLNQVTLHLGIYNNLDNLFGVFFLENKNGELSPLFPAEYHK